MKEYDHAERVATGLDVGVAVQSTAKHESGLPLAMRGDHGKIVAMTGEHTRVAWASGDTTWIETKLIELRPANAPRQIWLCVDCSQAVSYDEYSGMDSESRVAQVRRAVRALGPVAADMADNGDTIEDSDNEHTCDCCRERMSGYFYRYSKWDQS